MTEKSSSSSKKQPAPKLKEAAATQRMSKDELAQLIKKAEEDDKAKEKSEGDVDPDDDES